MAGITIRIAAGHHADPGGDLGFKQTAVAHPLPGSQFLNRENFAFQAHHRLKPQIGGGLVRKGAAAVEHDAGPGPAPHCLGMAQQGGGIGQGHGALPVPHQGVETLDLPIHTPGVVRIGKVGHIGHVPNGLGLGQEGLGGGQGGGGEAEPVHARIEFDEHRQLDRQTGPFNGFQLIQPMHRRGQAVFGQHGQVFSPEKTFQEQDGILDARFPQGDGLGKFQQGEAVGEIGQGSGHGDQAVAVGVGFDDGEQAGVTGGAITAGNGKIVTQRVQIDASANRAGHQAKYSLSFCLVKSTKVRRTWGWKRSWG